MWHVCLIVLAKYRPPRVSELARELEGEEEANRIIRVSQLFAARIHTGTSTQESACNIYNYNEERVAYSLVFSKKGIDVCLISSPASALYNNPYL